MKTVYDFAILGSGIAGSMTALVLAKKGHRVVVLERGRHPRFAIGESTVPTTTLTLRHIAARHGVPEIDQISSYLELRSRGLTAWPKLGFWFGHHREGCPLDPAHEMVFETLPVPHGPDTHVLRSAVDEFLVSKFEAYGVENRERTAVTDYRTDAEAATISIEDADGAHEVRARYVVDASGHASFLAGRFGLRQDPPKLHTRTRAIFSHFRGVPDLDTSLGAPNPAFRVRRSGTTMHHCFDGGWIWVIPFDSGVTSVGLELDLDRFPLDESIDPLEEMRSLIARFPSMQAHLGRMEPIRPMVRTGRVQFRTNGILGERFILTPHAAGFIEPLFSSGILLTAGFIARFADAVDRKGTELTESDLRPIETAFFREVDHVDRLVDGVIRSYRHHEVFKQMWRAWVTASSLQYTTRVLGLHEACEGPTLLYGAGVEPFHAAVGKMHARVLAGGDPIEQAKDLEAIIAPLQPRALFDEGSFGVGAPRALNTFGQQGEPFKLWLGEVAARNPVIGGPANLLNAKAWSEASHRLLDEIKAREAASRAEGTELAKAVDHLKSLVAPNNPYPV